MLKKLLLACTTALACGATTTASASYDPYAPDFQVTQCERYGGVFCDPEMNKEYVPPPPPPPPPPKS